MSKEAQSPQDRREREGTPRWVKLSGFVTALLVVSFAVLHLMGGGMRRHRGHDRLDGARPSRHEAP